jgi:hypothetical protein
LISPFFWEYLRAISSRCLVAMLLLDPIRLFMREPIPALTLTQERQLDRSTL